jgi:chorismate synthase
VNVKCGMGISQKLMEGSVCVTLAHHTESVAGVHGLISTGMILFCSCSAFPNTEIYRTTAVCETLTETKEKARIAEHSRIDPDREHGLTT